jgi:hypothetical protein
MSRIISHFKNCTDDSMFSKNDDHEVDEYGNLTARGIVKQLCIEGDSTLH